VVEHRLVPRNIEEVKYFGQRGSRPQDELLVIDHQAIPRPNLFAVVVHHADGVVPLLQTLSVAAQVETSDCHLKPNVKHQNTGFTNNNFEAETRHNLQQDC